MRTRSAGHAYPKHPAPIRGGPGERNRVMTAGLTATRPTPSSRHRWMFRTHLALSGSGKSSRQKQPRVSSRMRELLQTSAATVSMFLHSKASLRPPAGPARRSAADAVSCAIPLSADEGLSSIFDAGVLGARDAVDIFSIKLAKHGGLTNAKKIAAFAECTGKKCFVNSMIEMGVSVTASKHFLASTPNIVPVGHALMSTERLKDDILKTPIRIKNGFTELPKGPGLGIEIDEGKIEEYSIGN